MKLDEIHSCCFLPPSPLLLQSDHGSQGTLPQTRQSVTKETGLVVVPQCLGSTLLCGLISDDCGECQLLLYLFIWLCSSSAKLAGSKPGLRSEQKDYSLGGPVNSKESTKGVDTKPGSTCR